jgi:hypothetical protein
MAQSCPLWSNNPPLMLYMVIERFRAGPEPVYARAAEQGRMLPDGLRYVDSWIDERDLSQCFQLMETDDADLLREWTSRWDDLVEFEIVPVIDSAGAAAKARTNTPADDRPI